MNELIIIEKKEEKSSPDAESVIQLEILPTQSETQLDQILAEVGLKEKLIECEKQRLEKLKRIRNEMQLRLSTIKEVNDFSHSESPSTSKDNQTHKEHSIGLQKKSKLASKYHLKNRTVFNEKEFVYYESVNFSQYFKDNSIDCRWKLLFAYYILIIAANITLNIIELYRYQQSFCRLSGFDNTLIYLNQIAYVACKFGILSIIYQEFTDTLPIKVSIPLFNQVIFSCIFPILSMPLYIFDFIQCQYRIKVFSLDQSLQILNLLDWLILSIIILVILQYSVFRLKISNNTVKQIMKYSKITYYLALIVVHCISIIMAIGQSFEDLMPAMIMENYYFLFSLFLMLYLSIQKYCFKKIIFKSQQESEIRRVQLINLLKQ